MWSRNRMLPGGFLILLALALLAPPAASGEQAPGVTVKSDGNDIVLIPREGKVFLILGFPGEKKGQEAIKDLSGRLSLVTGEARFPANEFARILIWELGPSGEVDMDRRTLASTRAKPLPPGCPPHCPGILAYLTCGGQLCDPAQWEAGTLDGVKVP